MKGVIGNVKPIYEYDLKWDYDFIIPDIKIGRSGPISVFLDFRARNSKHLMIKGGEPYAMFDFETNLWTMDRDRMIDILDEIVIDLCRRYKEDNQYADVVPLLFSKSSTKMIDAWNHFCCKQMWDNWEPLNQRVIFNNTEVKREDYASFKLPYDIAEGSIKNYKELFGKLYSEEEFRKLEWTTGAIISGASKRLQKMIVIFGTGGSGKSTWLDLQKDYIFKGYDSAVSIKDLCSGTMAFALEPLKNNPLISINDDAKLDRIDDNTTLNSVVSHATLTVNTKNKALYENRFNTMICVGSNTAIQIPDAKSGLLRRVIDVFPTGDKWDYKTYFRLKKGMEFEIGAIAYHCLKVFEELGEDYYEDYVPTRMMAATNYFYDFIDYEYSWFRESDTMSLSEIWKRYQEYVQKSALKFSMNRLMVKNQLQDYFDIYKKEGRIEGRHVKDLYSGFKYWKFGYEKKEDKKNEPVQSSVDETSKEEPTWLKFNCTSSLFDIMCSDCPAQLANSEDKPLMAWDKVTTTLSDILTTRVHYVKVPLNHIVIDFDLKDESGQKSFLLNWKAASQWPETYAELSKGGSGIHLHYLYSGDVEKLARLYAPDVEIKVFKGGASLRRRLSKCNDIPIATISSGLPLREVRKTGNWNGVISEAMLRRMVIKNLNKEYHANTKPSVDYIADLINSALVNEVEYDISALAADVKRFCESSTHNADYCMQKYQNMIFINKKPIDDSLIFFDIEIYPNLFVVCYKVMGPGNPVIKLINPSAHEIEELLQHKIVGFNNRKYDNHILWAASMGCTPLQLYKISQRIINEHDGYFPSAYSLSYTDVYDFASAGHKKSLKAFEIELGIHHQELNFKWDEPIDEKYWDLVCEYCANDVLATEAVFNYLKGDWTARKILAELSGLTPNDTTNQHSTKIIFGNDPNPQSQFIYTDLSIEFPGYEKYFDQKLGKWKSSYRGEDPGEGGYVYAEHGMYTNVCVLDVASMHPSTIEWLCLFGPHYTRIFSEIKQARVYIKHEDWDAAEKMMDGRLKPFLSDHSIAGDLSNALKTVINSVYGLTSAKFKNKFRDERNVDNIVAKRGALFMIDLKHAVQERGYTVAHIKTDSIKIPNATPEIIEFVMNYGKERGYTFEHESTYDRMCLVNNAVYIAKYASAEKCMDIYGYVPGHNKKALKKNSLWTATGAQFAQPYVFKSLFSKEALELKDFTEAKSVTSALYLDMNEGLPDVEKYEAEYDKLKKKFTKYQKERGFNDFGETFETTENPLFADERDRLADKISNGHNYVFVGRVGSFIPVKKGGGWLMRANGNSFANATGASGYRWIETETFDGDMSNIDIRYHESLVDDAIENMAKFGDVEWFLYSGEDSKPLPDFLKIPVGSGDEIPFEEAV